MTEKPEKMDLRSLDVADDKRRQLAQLFPEVVTETRTEDGKLVHAVDYERLKGVLGEFSEILENQRERYGMTWPGKNECLKIIQQPSIATLKPCREESVNFDETENLFIEGDNLEALKLLQKAYYGKVKMIYIDPPYNTGEEFIYPDDYSEDLETYLAYTGQVDDQGRVFSTNATSEGRFHSKWLRMMYPRLFLARNLLSDDGIAFVSIDDNEMPNLHKICDEIFGEENFIASFIWEKRTNRENRKVVSTRHDYVLCYCKTLDPKARALKQLPMNEKALANYKNPDNDPRGLWKSDPATAQAGHATKAQFYDLTAPNGKVHKLESGRCWLYTEPVMKEAIADNRIWFGKDGNGVPRIKTFLEAKERGLTPETILFAKDVTTTETAKNKLKALFDGVAVFETPKPVELLKLLLRLSCDDGIALDFFSGSCPLAEAVLALNKEDGQRRRFLAVQLPEPCEDGSEARRAGCETVAEIGKERIRRVIGKFDVGCLMDEVKDNQQATLFSETNQPSTIKNQTSLPPGFKVFKLDRSNFRLWDGVGMVDGGGLMVEGMSEEQIKHHTSKITHQLELHEQHIDPNATQEDILYELLFKAGFPLTTKVEPLYLVAGKLQKEEPRIDTNQHESKDKNISVHSCSLVVPKVFSIAEGALLICLQDEITKELIKAMADADPLQVICLDSGFKNNDQLKANAVQTFKARNKSAETATVFRTV